MIYDGCEYYVIFCDRMRRKKREVQSEYRWYKTKLSYLQNLSFEKMPFISYEVSLKSSKSKIFSYKHIVWLLLVIFKYTFSFSNTACLI